MTTACYYRLHRPLLSSFAFLPLLLFLVSNFFFFYVINYLFPFPPLFPSIFILFLTVYKTWWQSIRKERTKREDTKWCLFLVCWVEFIMLFILRTCENAVVLLCSPTNMISLTWQVLFSAEMRRIIRPITNLIIQQHFPVFMSMCCTFNNIIVLLICFFYSLHQPSFHQSHLYTQENIKFKHWKTQRSQF